MCENETGCYGIQETDKKAKTEGEGEPDTGEAHTQSKNINQTKHRRTLSPIDQAPTCPEIGIPHRRQRWNGINGIHP
jgi:hypothetical protein